ncbi:MAG: MmgE/PrpD family protein, partial [Rhizobiaceae bacterium]
MKSIDDPTQELCEFVAGLRYEMIPPEVIRSTKLLMIDWLGSALAGAGTRPAKAMQDFAQKMGPTSGKCTDFSSGPNTSAFFASMINAASSHVVEQDDLHNSSVLHPATVVFSALIAAAQDRDVSGAKFLAAAVAGYETGIRVGEFLGRSHYVHFHTTGTAGTLAAAAAVANLIGLDPIKTRHALGTAGTKAAGLWEFLVDGADSKQVHTASAASSGLFAAYSSEQGVTGPKRVFDGVHGMGAAMSSDSDPRFLNDRLGQRWATSETSYKWYASCRHTHPAADALLQLMQEASLEAADIKHVTAHVHQAAIDVLGPVIDPTTIHQAKFCLGSVLGLIAVHGNAGLAEFDQFALNDDRVLAFGKTVEMVLDPEIDAAYP